MQYRNIKMPMPSYNGVLNVNGTSSIEVKSDIVLIKADVSTEGKSIEVAQDKNSEVSGILIESLKDYGISSDDIYDEDISVSRVSSNDNSYYYYVTRIVAISIKDLSKLRYIYSLLIENGANDNINLTFMLSNPIYYYNKALKKATQDALNKAAFLAKNLNLKYCSTPIKINENSSPLYSITYYTPQNCGELPGLSPGLVRITAEVDATFKTYPC